MHIEPVAAAGELGLRDLTSVDVLLAWDDGDTLEQLKVQLAIIGRWAPIRPRSPTPLPRGKRSSGRALYSS